MAQTTIKDALLPALPVDPFTPSQWRTLLALAEAVVPAVAPRAIARSANLSVDDTRYSTALTAVQQLAGPDVEPDLAASFLAESPVSHPAFRESLHRMFGQYMPEANKRQISMILTLLGTRAGSLLMTGYSTPMADLPVNVREAILVSWTTARTPTLRQLARLFASLFKQNWAKTSPTLPRVLGFPRVPVHGAVGEGFPFDFLQFPPGDGVETIETDVVIVGSGCGASVCAKNLAEAGHRVIVAEKSYYWPPEYLPMTEQQGWDQLFMNGGFIMFLTTPADDTSVSIVAGQTFGGGGFVNWSASLQTQGFVREEWAAQGLPFFTSAEFQQSLDTVCERMGVSTDHIRHNPTNQTLLEGARKMGWAHKAVPQNTGRTEHYCGYCTMGCASCGKQGPTVSFLPDAARAGAKFIEGLDVRKVLFEKRQGKKAAVGVRGVWRSRDTNGGVSGASTTRQVIIRAKRVVVACGTMQSPLLLLRSGLRNPNIGRHLHLHPVSLLGAVYPSRVNPWEGGILTAVVNEFENLDGHGHGAKLEAVNMIPSAWLAFPPWSGGLDYKLFVPRMKHMTGYISLARDRDHGRVYPDPVDGRCRVQYSVSRFDARHILEGMIGLAKLQYVAGASEIVAMVPGVPSFVRSPSSALESAGNSGDGINDPRFRAWLDGLRKRGFASPDSMFLSAHQMGTCRMGAKAGTSVVDARGRVWEAEGLYVADASVFPSASGVNPMVTNMGIADWELGVERTR
ncbi:long-chain fatty alcohol dehydrogenase [Saccharata proteae CBS 121410]|uniref:Long-chain-alcohol oxidase n=1 Tax=Saccharata proteae CBS 121410 TaxID=1314787 RepID=A0A9P4HXI1_9PEZI|nr:long-chain fatty alcohol dehydrogenase [Saccharata proteae CBS 121410]